MRRRRAALLAVTAALLAPTTAQAGGLGYDDEGGLLYVAFPDFDGGVAHDLHVDQVGDQYRLTDAGGGLGIAIIDGTPCFARGPREARCLVEYVRDLSIFLGDASDEVTINAALPVTVCGGGGADVVTAGSGADFLDGGAGPDDVRGGAGDDLFFSLAKVYPRAAACRPGEPSPQGDRYDGGPGDDHLEGDGGRDLISGGDGSDRLYGYEGGDRLEGDGGTDFLFGMTGNDELDGGAGADHVFGGPGDDRLDGGPGDDFLGETVRFNAARASDPEAMVTVGEDGDDRFDGGEGDDALIAGPGTSVVNFEDALSLLGEVIDRSLLSAALNGADHYRGGPGYDDVTYLNRDRAVHVTLDGIANDGSPGEGDAVDPDVEVVFGGAREDNLVAAPEGSFLFGDLGDDLLFGGPAADILSGGNDEGRDRLSGGGGGDELRGGGGDDHLDGNDGRDLMFAGPGDDVAFGGRDSDALEGGAGGDLLDGGDGSDCVSGFSSPPDQGPPCPSSPDPPVTAGADGNDILRGGPGTDRLDGGAGEDVADYSLLREPVIVALPGAPSGLALGRSADTDQFVAGVEAIRGGGGDDTLIGNAADNLLDGGPGHDHLVGAGGSDRLRGGSGSDLLEADDGAADAVRCGAQRDLALIDEDDEVISGLADACEIADPAGATGLPLVAPAAACPLPVRFPGVPRTFRLRRPASVFWGSLVDAARCPANVRGAPGTRPGRRPARLSGGAVALGRRGSRLVARLTGGRATPCDDRIVVTRRLDVRHAPSGFFARGRTLVATGAGASWQMVDGCRRTRVHSLRGRVRVSRDVARPG